MNFEELLDHMPVQYYDDLKSAVELGKWHDGTVLTEQQRSDGLAILIAYDIRHKAVDERIGYIPQSASKLCSDDQLAVTESSTAISPDRLIKKSG